MTLPTVAYKVRVRCGTPGSICASGIQVPKAATITSASNTVTAASVSRVLPASCRASRARVARASCASQYIVVGRVYNWPTMTMAVR